MFVRSLVRCVFSTRNLSIYLSIYRGDKELLLQSQQPPADGLRVSHDRSERDALLVVHLERARAPPREPVVGAVNRALALGSLGKLARLLAVHIHSLLTVWRVLGCIHE